MPLQWLAVKCRVVIFFRIAQPDGGLEGVEFEPEDYQECSHEDDIEEGKS